MHRYLLCLAGLLVWPVASNARTAREHGAHVHGTTTIDIAQDGKQLSIGFEMPGMNAVGYEHPPRSDVEQAQLDAALKILNSPVDWFVPNAEARCKITGLEVTPNGFGASSSAATAGVEAKSAEHHEHADVDVRYQYECEAPLNLRSIDLRLIERFPQTHEVRVNIVSPGGQAQEQFSSHQATITLSPAAP
jgi:hypothetical protein